MKNDIKVERESVENDFRELRTVASFGRPKIRTGRACGGDKFTSDETGSRASKGGPS